MMKAINVSYLMSHDTGVVQHYYRPTEDDLLTEYLKTVDLLTINEENRLKIKVDELSQKTQDNEYIIKSKLLEKDEEITEMKEQIKLLMQSRSEILECLKHPDKIMQISQED